MKNICVLGSINMDEVLRVENLVKSGETIFSKEFKKNAGGKGANQAVAVKRLGVKVYMIAKVGSDENGKSLLETLEKDNIDISYINIDKKNPTGIAVIMVDDKGRNSIVVVPGANMEITENEIVNAQDIIKNSSSIIAQFETPMAATIEAFKIAKQSGVTTILNPAPAAEIPENLLSLTDIIIPNETEAFEITKIKVEDTEDIKKAGEKLIEKGVKFAIITLGERGVAIVSKEKFEIISAYKVNAIDTTAAGDSFIGALSVKLQEEELSFESIKKAVKFANKVSSIVVQKEGAQASLPYLQEVLDVFNSYC